MIYVLCDIFFQISIYVLFYDFINTSQFYNIFQPFQWKMCFTSN